jgi:hypothetical protein
MQRITPACLYVAISIVIFSQQKDAYEKRIFSQYFALAITIQPTNSHAMKSTAAKITFD